MGLNTKTQVPVKINYEGEIVGEYFADIVLEDKVVLALKAVEYLEAIHEAQLLNYLNAAEYKVGLLVNFTYPKAIIKKLVL
jgi:GxxExxY protein